MVDDILAALPKHDGGLFIEHNPHRIAYASAAEWERDTSPTWESIDARARALAADDLWMMQWYPDTPVGCHVIAAPTLAELVDLARQHR